MQRCRSIGISGQPKRGAEDVPLDRHLERRVVRNRDPVRIVGGLDEFRRHRIARRPQFHRPVVDGISTAENRGAGIGGVAMGSDFAEHQHAAGFEVPVQRMRSAIPGSYYGLGGRTAAGCGSAGGISIGLIDAGAGGVGLILRARTWSRFAIRRIEPLPVQISAAKPEVLVRFAKHVLPRLRVEFDAVLGNPRRRQLDDFAEQRSPFRFRTFTINRGCPGHQEHGSTPRCEPGPDRTNVCQSDAERSGSILFQVANDLRGEEASPRYWN